MEPKTRWVLEALRFYRRHWVHLLLAPLLGFTAVTFLHEAAHAAAAIALGGTVTDLSIVPDATTFGHTTVSGVIFPECVSAAPYVMWCALASLTALVALARRAPPFWLASTLFVWGFVVPLLDVANGAAGWFAGSGDFAQALGRADGFDALGLLCVAPVLALLAFFLQRRLYAERALSLGGFVATCALGSFALYGSAELLDAGARAVGIR